MYVGMYAWAETWRRIWGTKKIFRGPISGKISIFKVKISDDLFFSHRHGSSDFPFLFSHFPYIYYVKCRRPFPHKKTTIFHSVHTFTHIRQAFHLGVLSGVEPCTDVIVRGFVVGSRRLLTWGFSHSHLHFTFLFCSGSSRAPTSLCRRRDAGGSKISGRGGRGAAAVVKGF